MPIVDVGGNQVEFPDNLPPEQLKQAVSSAARKMGVASRGDRAMQFIRPILEVGGGVGGAALAGGVATPLASAGGAALGISGGKAVADYIDRVRGAKQPLTSIPEMLKETASNLKYGAASEAGGRLVGRIAPPIMEAVGARIAKGAGALGRVLSGVKQSSGERLFKDPGAFYTKTVGKAGEELGAVRQKMGINTTRTPEEIYSPELGVSRKLAKENVELIQKSENLKPLEDALSKARREDAFAKSYLESALSKAKANKKATLPIREQLQKLRPTANSVEEEIGRISKSVTPSIMVKTLQAIDDIIEATPIKQRAVRSAMFNDKAKIVEKLSKIAGPERVASQQFARSALAGDFRKFFPVTKTGDISLMRTLGLPAMEGGGVGVGAALPTTLAQSPFLSGLAISTAGAGYKALKGLMKVPSTRRAVVQALIKKSNGAENGER